MEMLIDKKMNKINLHEQAHVSKNAIAMGKVRFLKRFTSHVIIRFMTLLILYLMKMKREILTARSIICVV